MKKALLTLLLLVATPVWADGQPTSDSPLEPFAFETITVSTTALGFTEATYKPSTGAPAQRAFVSCQTSPIRYRYEGGTPTASVGHYKTAGQDFTVNSAYAVRTFRMIRDTTASSDATCTVTYER